MRAYWINHLFAVFQQTDVEEAPYTGDSPTIRMFGVTEVRFSVTLVVSNSSDTVSKAGHSVLAHVTDFLPYFYVSVPRGFVDEDIAKLRVHLNNQIDQPDAVKPLQLVQKRSLWGYRGDAKPLFLKITICDQKTLPRIRGLFERGEVQYDDGNLFAEPVTTYESNIAYTLRFMIDTQVCPSQTSPSD